MTNHTSSTDSRIIRRENIVLGTTKEAAGDAETGWSTMLLEEAGYIESFGAGLYGLSELGQQSRIRLERLIRQEMNSVGGHEISLPILQYDNDWRDSGRWDSFENEMFTLRNREGRDMCLAPSHEEGVVRLLRNRIRSYDDLPHVVYQLQQKHRDDHARNGLLRCKEFLMKDAYSLHTDTDDLYGTYRDMRLAYMRIFDALNLDYSIVDAEAGVMGGGMSEEFVAVSDTGRDTLLSCATGSCTFGLTDEHHAFDRFDDRDICPLCGEELTVTAGIEVGHIFALGTRYSDAMDFMYDTETGSKRPVVMGSYGIGISRTLQAVVEQNSSTEGCVWPVTDWGTLAPFDAAVIVPGDSEKRRTAAENVAQTLEHGNRILTYSGSDMSAGEQFAEADKIGIPRKIIIGNRWEDEGVIEIEYRDGSKQLVEDISNVALYE